MTFQFCIKLAAVSWVPEWWGLRPRSRLAMSGHGTLAPQPQLALLLIPASDLSYQKRVFVFYIRHRRGFCSALAPETGKLSWLKFS